ncbi:MAG: sugar ABC transporter permease [Bacillota bacterium]|jgi:ABC-type sugar transport system permease subunit|nr:sugar ABC transporter permease [Bacillota bacterium]HHT91548.1 sugar ABC transporter permease [Bacillota bacterium]
MQSIETVTTQGRRRAALRRTIIGYSFLTPASTVMILFIFVPVFMAFYLSMFEWDLISPMRFVGWQNYARIFGSSDFYIAVRNTLYFVLVQLPLDFGISLGVAMLLNQKIRGLSFYRTVFFTPVITSTVAVSAVWMWLYDPFDGLFNYLLELVNLSPIGWLNDPKWAMFSVILMTVWKGLGYNVVIFLAGLQNIDSSLYEAASIDGANSWQQFRRITLPQLSPTMYFVLIMGVINSFKVFTQIDVMTPGGGPLKSTMVIVYLIYMRAFNSFRFGEASALSVLLFLFVLSLTLLQRFFLEKRVHYN